MILSLALTFTLTLSAQNHFHYHESINKAEELLADERFELALQIYQSVFHEYDFVFAKDYFIAAQVSAFQGNDSLTYKLLKSAVKSGLKDTCIGGNQLFERFRQTPFWDTLRTNYPVWRKAYLKSIDMALISEFSKRYNLEQDFKRDPDYQYIVQQNFDRIKQLILADSFPGDQLVGLDDSKLTVKNNDCNCGNSKVIVTLLHQPFAFSELEPLLIKAVERGDLHPREYATIYTREKRFVSVLYNNTDQLPDNFPIYYFNFPFDQKEENLENVNTDRSKVGISSIEVDEGKRKLENKYGFKLFFGYR
jgi:hypothetical protein